MKSLIASLFLTIYTTVLKLMRTGGLIKIQDSSALVLPPTEKSGNLGDEALIAGTVNYLKQKGVNKIDLIDRSSEPMWEGFSSVNKTMNMSGLTSHSSWHYWTTLLRFVFLVSRYEQFYFFGADVLDGGYSSSNKPEKLKPSKSGKLELISLAAATGTDTTIIGCSFNDKPTLDSVHSLRTLPSKVRICARDPISKERLVKYLDRPIELVADVAFLLLPSVDSEPTYKICEWIARQQANGRLVMGFNPYNKPRLMEGVGGKTFNDFVKVYVDTLVEIYSQKQVISFVLIPHDLRGSQFNDITLIEAIFENLPPEIQSHTLKVITPFTEADTKVTAADVKAIVGKLDLVLSGKFHLAIACLGQGTPVACITYQGKFEGLFKHFDIEGLMIEPEKALQSGNLAKFLVPVIENRDNIRQQIQSKLPKIQELAQANFG
ncbi:polysaccharide pyruvyl transferase family protein [Coleofasciculus chthonoplastes]|uniref:polysaccharide pyruvyl transferase family protein n=1 Tax=Coleofasciculus chthonoplastes TaxID=64178 RepID=UPI0032FC3F14